MEYLKVHRKTQEMYGEKEYNRMVFSEIILCYWLESLIADMFDEYRHSYLLQARIAMNRVNEVLFGNKAKDSVKEAYSNLAMNTDDKLTNINAQLQAEYFRLLKDNQAAKVRCLYFWFNMVEDTINENAERMIKACNASIEYMSKEHIETASNFIARLAKEWKSPQVVESERIQQIKKNFIRKIKDVEFVESIYKTDE